jgi:ABC-2 type transport system permease protein
MNSHRGVYAIARREVLRMSRAWKMQIVFPIVFWPAFVLLLGTIFGGRIGSLGGTGFRHFLLPGMYTMAMSVMVPLSAAAAIWQASHDGYLDAVLCAPLRSTAVALGYVVGIAVRPLAVGAALVSVACLLDAPPERPLVLLIGGVLTIALLVAFGLALGLSCRKYETLYFAGNLPRMLTFVSGSFFPISLLGAGLRQLVWLNPLFYPTQAVRAGMIGTADAPVWLSLAVTAALATAAMGILLSLFSAARPTAARPRRGAASQPRSAAQRASHGAGRDVGPERRRRGVVALARQQAGRASRAWPSQLVFPVVTHALNAISWGLVLGKLIGPIDGTDYKRFLAPGVCAVAIGFTAAQASAAITWQAKHDRYLDDVLAAPLHPAEVVLGYALGLSLRPVLVGVGTLSVAVLLLTAPIERPWVLLAAIMLTIVTWVAAGLILGVSCRDQQRLGFFILMHELLANVSGYLFGIGGIGPPFRMLVWLNPIFYQVQAVRAGMIGTADAPLWLSLTVSAALMVAAVATALWVFTTGRA